MSSTIFEKSVESLRRFVWARKLAGNPVSKSELVEIPSSVVNAADIVSTTTGTSVSGYRSNKPTNEIPTWTMDNMDRGGKLASLAKNYQLWQSELAG
jgi:hypothetical protein